MKKIIFTLLIFSVVLMNASGQTMNVTYKSITKESPDKSYTVSAEYPQVDFGPDALMGVRGIAQDINYSLDTIVNGIIRDFVNDVSGMPEKTVNGNNSSLEITSKGWVSNGSLFCAELTTFDNIAGMAHPMTTVTGFNYTDNGEGPLDISNLFLSNSDYINYISNYCIAELRAKAKKEGFDNIDDMITQGASPDIKNFNVWTVKDDSLNIIFNPYQVGPYVMGMQTVPIALSSLTSMLDPKGPLSFMFR
jgi:Protein of unknown function (DUF3298)